MSSLQQLPEKMSGERTYEEVVRELAESLSRPRSFTEVQILSNLKPGLEVPLMGISTMGDSLSLIYQRRKEEDAEVKMTILLAAGIGPNGYEGFDLPTAIKKVDGFLEAEKAEEKRQVFERIKIRLQRLEKMEDKDRIEMLERLQHRLLTEGKHIRYQHSIHLVEDMVANFCKFSMALQGESQRSKQVLSAIQAIVLHEKDQLEQLMGKKEPLRDRIGKRLHLGGPK